MDDQLTPREAAQFAVNRMEALSKAGFEQQLRSTSDDCVVMGGPHAG